MNDFSEHVPIAAAVYSIKSVGLATRIAPHFQLQEMRCKDGNDIVLVHPALLVLLETIRNHFGQPIKINSGYRTRAWNAMVSRSKASKHLFGMAADIVVRGVDPLQVALLAEELGVGGVGRYNTFTHVDVYGKNRRFDYRT